MSVAVSESAVKTPEPSTYSIMRFQYDPMVVTQIGSCGSSSPEIATGTNGGSTSRRMALSKVSRIAFLYSTATVTSFADCSVSPKSASSTDMSRSARQQL